MNRLLGNNYKQHQQKENEKKTCTKTKSKMETFPVSFCANKSGPLPACIRLAFVIVALISLSSHQLQLMAFGQGVKGGGAIITEQPILANSGPNSGSSNQQLSATFFQMFNQLTPIQQQQFIKQMSSSENRQVIQQEPIIQQPQSQQSSSSFSSEQIVSSTSGSGSGQRPAQIQANLAGTKSASFKQSSAKSASTKSFVQPVQQQQQFRSRESKIIVSPPKQITIVQQPQQQQQEFSSFSRKVASISRPHVVTTLPSASSSSSKEFQLSRSVLGSVQPQQQQQSAYFDRVQQVQQVAQPVVLPTKNEQSFQRVQSFSSSSSSQPVAPSPPAVVEQSFSQQIVQQQDQSPPLLAPPPPPTQTQSSFSRLQESQFLQSNPQPSVQPIANFNQFSTSTSSSSSSNLAGGKVGAVAGDFNSVAGALQQEKVELSSFNNLDGSSVNTVNTPSDFSSSFSQQTNSQQISQPGGNIIIPNLSAETSSSLSSFESGDVQQRNLAVPDDFFGLTAASINNKWYIMRPVENPSLLGLGDASKGGQVVLSNRQAARGVLSAGQKAKPLESGANFAKLIGTTTNAKKRSSGESDELTNNEADSSSSKPIETFNSELENLKDDSE